MKVELLILVQGYLLGSIPFGFLIIKLAEGADVRKSGSGNIGATNVYRKSKWAGIATMLLDGGKGYLAVLIAGWMGGDIQWQSIAAVAAIVGHIYTVFLRFKGGKGVATGAGAYLAVAPAAVGTTLVLFTLVVLTTRYISLASILATAAFPLWAYLYHEPWGVILWGIIGSALIVAKHHQNIRRLLTGSESKFAFGRRA